MASPTQDLSLAERRRRRRAVAMASVNTPQEKRRGWERLKPQARTAAPVASEEGPRAVQQQLQASTKIAASAVMTMAGATWLTGALLADRVVGPQLNGAMASVITAFVLTWTIVPLLPASKGASFLGLGFLTCVLGAALAFASAALPGGLALVAIASLLLGTVVDAACLRMGPRNGLRRIRLFVPVVVAAVALYIPASTPIGQWMAPITPLAVGVGAAIAVALLLQDQLGLSAAAFRHGKSDVVQATLTRFCEVPRAVWILVFDALSLGSEGDAAPLKS